MTSSIIEDYLKKGILKDTPIGYVILRSEISADAIATTTKTLIIPKNSIMPIIHSNCLKLIDGIPAVEYHGKGPLFYSER